MSNSIGEVATAELPPEDVVQKLRDFLQTLKSFGAEGDQMVDASSALTALVDDLEQKAMPITTPGSTPSKRWSCERPKLVLCLFGNNCQGASGRTTPATPLRQVFFLNLWTE
jgi:hypothetical protein